MRLIDADALIDFIDCGHLRNPLESCLSEHNIINMLKARPTIDSVEVVRCKDCTYYCPASDGHGGEMHYGFCINRHDGTCGATRNRYERDFCSYGERKDGAEGQHKMTNVEALECFESDCETCQFKGRDCKSCRTKVAISALRREIKN